MSLLTFNPLDREKIKIFIYKAYEFSMKLSSTNLTLPISPSLFITICELKNLKVTMIQVNFNYSNF